MNDEITIEHGIPIPKSRHGSPHVSDALKKMEIGDSIVVTQRQCNSALTMGNYLKIKLKSRTMENGVRIWRVG